MITRNLDWQGPRNLTGGDGYLVDLGMVSLRDAAINGRNNILIPYADGRLISRVRFVPPLTITIPDLDWNGNFLTPNTGWIGNGTNGFAVISSDQSFDTIGIQIDEHCTDLFGDAQFRAQILDCTPLIFVVKTGSAAQSQYRPLLAWQADTAYCGTDAILDSNDHVQSAGGGAGGVSGSELPDFDDEGGTTSDGTLTWHDLGPVPQGQVHVIAEVIEGVSPMPPCPAKIEFIDPPSNVEAGSPMADITVIIKDQNGDPYIFPINSGVSIALNCLGDNDGNTVFETNVSTDPTTGISTFSSLTPTEPGTFVLRACTLPTLTVDPIFSDPFDVTAP